MAETHDYELERCERCGAIIGTKKHLTWLCDRLGPLAYTNPSLLLAKASELSGEPTDGSAPQVTGVETGDFMRLLCSKCKYDLNIRL